ncbi:MAG: AraC family transcriptional regulator [Caldilinea sp. CFX5]|nr:AraC family transcriptional regulator [Caldilinea sp. CFX5]
MSASLTNFKIVDLPAFHVVGKEIRCIMGHPSGNPIPALWAQCFKDGTMATLDHLPGRIFTDTYVGWMGQFDPRDNTFSYVVGVATGADAATPETMTAIEMPAARFAVATVTGDEPDIYVQAHDLLDREVKAQQLAFNERMGCCMEWYDERFHPQNPGAFTIDYYEPVTK